MLILRPKRAAHEVPAAGSAERHHPHHHRSHGGARGCFVRERNSIQQAYFPAAVNSRTLESALDDLELRFDRLRTSYEQYVGGRQDVDPLHVEVDIGRRLARLEEHLPPGAGASQRLMLLRERYANFQRYGERLARRMKAEPTGSVPPSSAPVLRGTALGGPQWTDRTPPLGTPALVTPSMHGDAPVDSERVAPASVLPDRQEVATPSRRTEPAVTVSRIHTVLPPSSVPPPSVAPEDTAMTVQDLRPAFEDDLETLPKHSVERPSAAPASGLSADVVRALHQRLLAATPDNGRTTSVERLASMLRETELRLLERYPGRSVSFDVVVRDGKPIIKPTVR